MCIPYRYYYVFCLAYSRLPCSSVCLSVYVFLSLFVSVPSCLSIYLSVRLCNLSAWPVWSRMRRNPFWCTVVTTLNGIVSVSGFRLWNWSYHSLCRTDNAIYSMFLRSLYIYIYFAKFHKCKNESLSGNNTRLRAEDWCATRVPRY
jgi:hypothetical protein